MRAASSKAKKAEEGGKAWGLVDFSMTVDPVGTMLDEGATRVCVEDIIPLKAWESLRAEELQSPET
jgi:hypothetical protein